MGCTIAVAEQNAFADGLTILMKNRDATGTYQKPVRVGRRGNCFSYLYVVAPQVINERGLAMSNTTNSYPPCKGSLASMENIGMIEIDGVAYPKDRVVIDETTGEPYVTDIDTTKIAGLPSLGCYDYDNQTDCQAAGCRWYDDRNGGGCYPSSGFFWWYVPANFEHTEDAVAWMNIYGSGLTDMFGIIDRFGVGAMMYGCGPNGITVWLNDFNHFGGCSNAPHVCDMPPYGNYPNSGWTATYCDARCGRINSRLYDEINGGGSISFLDMIQKVSRDQNNAEKGTGCYYRSNSYPCRSPTRLTTCAVNVDPRYEGKLTTWWVNFGENAVVGVFLPIMPYASTPSIFTSGNGMAQYVLAKRNWCSANCSSTSYYEAERVRHIQKYSFFAEKWGWSEYKKYLNELPDGLTDQEVWDSNTAFVQRVVDMMTDMYINENLHQTVTDEESVNIGVI